MFKQFYFFVICIWTANYILHQLIWPLLLQTYNYCVHKLPDFQKPWSKSPGVNRETDQNGCLIKCMLKVQFRIKTWWLLTTIDRWPPFRGQSYRIFNPEEIKWLHTNERWPLWQFWLYLDIHKYLRAEITFIHQNEKSSDYFKCFRFIHNQK